MFNESRMMDENNQHARFTPPRLDLEEIKKAMHDHGASYHHHHYHHNALTGPGGNHRTSGTGGGMKRTPSGTKLSGLCSPTRHSHAPGAGGMRRTPSETKLYGLGSPTSSHSITSSICGMKRVPSETKFNCLCSPTTHVGSFRCRFHRNSSPRNGSKSFINLSNLADQD